MHCAGVLKDGRARAWQRKTEEHFKESSLSSLLKRSPEPDAAARHCQIDKCGNVLLLLNQRLLWQLLFFLHWAFSAKWFFFFFLVVVCLFRPHFTACRILVPQPGFEPGPPEVDMWRPNRWIAREFPWQFWNGKSPRQAAFGHLTEREGTVRPDHRVGHYRGWTGSKFGIERKIFLLQSWGDWAAPLVYRDFGLGFSGACLWW